LSAPVQVIAWRTTSEMMYNVKQDVKPHSLIHSLSSLQTFPENFV